MIMRIRSGASNPAFTLNPGGHHREVEVTITGNKNGKFALTGAFPNDRSQWLPG